MEPTNEQIFSKWLELVDHEILKKNYKQYLTKTTTEGLTESDTVISSESFYIAKIQIQEKSADIESREPKHVIPISNTNSKGPYHEFSNAIEYDNWPGKPFVKLWKSINPYNCPDCAGKGFNACDCERGAVLCKNCSGKGNETCPSCGGKGNGIEKVNIIDGITNQKRIEELTFHCGSCFGEGTVVCHSCAGVGKTSHSTCSGSGKLRCKTCKGVGKLVEIREEPVPIKTKVKDYIFTGFSNKENEDIFQLIKSKKLTMQSSSVQKVDDVDLKDLEALLSEDRANSKSLEKFIKELNRECKNILKSKNEIISPPIIVYSNKKLICKATKGGNFNILSFGEKSDFEVLAIGLKS